MTHGINEINIDYPYEPTYLFKRERTYELNKFKHLL